MKPLLWAVLVIAVIAAPAWGGTPKNDPATPEPSLSFSKFDEVVIQIEDLDAWMTAHRSRPELREMNRAMGHACERLRDVEGLVAALARDREFTSEKARVEELKRFQVSLALMGNELSGWQAALGQLAQEQQAAPGQAVTDKDRAPCEQARAGMLERRGRLEREAAALEEAFLRVQGRPELSESARAIGEVAVQLTPVLQAIDRLESDPALDRDCLSRISEAQGRLGGVLLQLESCRSCLTNLGPKS